MPNKVSASGFAAIPYKLMDQADASTWAVYAVLHRHGWNSEQGCWQPQGRSTVFEVVEANRMD
jgi:hypothetical protein